MERDPVERRFFCGIEITEADIQEAMREIGGYLDITSGDFRQIYLSAFRHAVDRIAGGSRVSEIMTTSPVTVASDMLLPEAAAIMAESRVSGVPVLDAEGRVEGVLSEKDFLAQMSGGKKVGFMEIVRTCLHDKVCVAAPIRKKRVSEIMSSPALAVTPEDTVLTVAELLKAHGYNRLPVVDPERKPVGIVTRGDMVAAYGERG